MLAKKQPTAPEENLERIRHTMQRYISRIMVDAVLQKATEDCGHSREDLLTGADLEAIVEDCMVGLRLFVDERRLPELMLALTEILMETSDAQHDAPNFPRTLSGTYRSGRTNR